MIPRQTPVPADHLLRSPAAAEELDRFLASALKGGGAPWPSAWSSADALLEARGRIEFHGIATRLVGSGADLSRWPEEVARFVVDEARVRTLWEALHAKAVGEAIERLSQAGVASLVLKGTALAYSVWDNPADRARGDTDLFVHHNSFNRARACLAGGGWVVGDRQPFQETWVLDRDGFEHAIDLHWRLRAGLVEPPMLAFEACAARSIPLPRLSANARMTDYATTLVNCALNHAAHRRTGYANAPDGAGPAVHLGLAADVDRLARTLQQADWTTVLALCREGGMARAVDAALSLARDWLGSSYPAAFVDELETLVAADQGTRDAWSGPREPGSLETFRGRFRAAIGWRAKWAYVRWRIWPAAREFAVEGRTPQGGALLLARLRRMAGLAAALVRKPKR